MAALLCIWIASTHGIPGGQPASFLPQFTGSYGSSISEHERFGREMGRQFAAAARQRLARERNARLVEWCSSDAAGVRTLARFAEVHERMYPEYMAELRGIASGVGVPFHSILALNLHQVAARVLSSAHSHRTRASLIETSTSHPYPIRPSSSASRSAPPATRAPSPPRRAALSRASQELAHFAPNRSAVVPMASHCSDYALWPWVAHNEDSGVEEEGTLFLADVQIDGASFYTAAYAGDLPAGAFGFNSFGVGFSLNMVDPTDAQLGGVGRGFVSRALLRSSSMREALALSTADTQCVGHSYQLVALAAEGGGEIAQVEAVSRGRHAVTPARNGSGPLFHSNHLLHLTGVAQRISQSSAHRLERARSLPRPRSARDLVSVLADQGDASYPILHDAASRAAGDISGEATLARALFDLVRGTLTLLAGSAAEQPLVVQIPRPPRPPAGRAHDHVSNLIS
jgi:hypothetical protein